MAACPSCGAGVEPGDRFCRECGAPLVAEAVDATGIIELGDSGPIPVLDLPGLTDLGPGTAVLVVRRGPNEGTRFVLDADELLAGRASDSAIFLDDVTVSRRHATFTRSDAGWVVTDVGSLNGTYVDRTRIEAPVLLSSGDEVQIGKYRFVYLVADEVARG